MFLEDAITHVEGLPIGFLRSEDIGILLRIAYVAGEHLPRDLVDRVNTIADSALSEVERMGITENVDLNRRLSRR